MKSPPAPLPTRRLLKASPPAFTSRMNCSSHCFKYNSPAQPAVPPTQKIRVIRLIRLSVPHSCSSSARSNCSSHCFKYNSTPTTILRIPKPLHLPPRPLLSSSCPSCLCGESISAHLTPILLQRLIAFSVFSASVLFVPQCSNSLVKYPYPNRAIRLPLFLPRSRYDPKHLQHHRT